MTGDPLALLWAAHARDLLRLATALTGEPSSAQRVVEDAFTTVGARRRTARRLDAAGAALRRAVVVGARRVPPEPHPEAAPVVHALADLPRRSREALVLRALDGLTDAELADVVGGSRERVRGALSRGRIELGADEDELAAALDDPALEPDPAGLPDVRRRVAERRSPRRLLRPAAVLAASTVVAAAAAVGVDATAGEVRLPAPVEEQTRDERRAEDPDGCSGDGDRLCEAPPEPPPLPSSRGVTTSTQDALPVWPFTSDAEAADWRADPGDRRWAGELEEVGRRFAEQVLGLAGAAAVPAGDAEVAVEHAGRRVGTVQLTRVGREPDGPWSVTGMRSAGFSAESAGEVGLYDALTGARLRQLSFAEDGERDSDPVRGGRDAVLWVRTAADGCRSEVVRIGLYGGASGTAVVAAPVRRSRPSMSADGRMLAWLEEPCGGGPQAVVVRDPGARVRRVPLGRERATEVRVRDDGAAVVELPERVVVLPPTATALSAGRVVDAGACRHGAPSWSGPDLLVFATCDGGQRGLVLAAPGFGRGVRPPGPTVTGVARSSVVDGLVLVQLADGPVGRYTDDRLVLVPGTQGLTDASW